VASTLLDRIFDVSAADDGDAKAYEANVKGLMQASYEKINQESDNMYPLVYDSMRRQVYSQYVGRDPRIIIESDQKDPNGMGLYRTIEKPFVPSSIASKVSVP
jgi:hypothetical protein